MADFGNVSQIAGGYAPMVGTGGYQPGNPFDGLPGAQTGIGQLIAPFATPFIQSFMTSHGYRPYGHTDQNFVDRSRALQMSQVQRQFMQHAANHEAVNFQKTLEQTWHRTRKPGMPTEMDEETKASFQRVSEGISSLGPIAGAIAPSAWEAIVGGGNSSMLMGQEMLTGSRLRLDPVTGQYGMGLESTKKLHGDLFDSYFGGPPGAWRGRTNGFSARQMGQMVTALQSRGMIAGAGDPSEQAMAALTSGKVDVMGALKRTGIDPESIRTKSGALDVGKLNETQLADLAQTPELETSIRGFDVEKVKKATEKYKGVLSAMRDIFGDAGHKNVPIQELVNAVEAFTGGAMAQIEPSRLETMVRTTHQIAKQAGVSMDQVMMMQQGFGQRAQQMGLDPVFASYATQRATAALGAFGDAGLGANAAWGKLNATQFAQVVGNMQLSGNASEIGNLVGAARRIEESVGRDNIKEGTKTAAYMDAIRTGNTSFVDPTTGERTWVGSVKAGELSQMVAADSGGTITADQATAFIDDTHSNQGMTATSGDPTYIARMQAEGMRRRVVAPGMTAAFRARFGNAAEGMGETMSKTWLTMTDDQATNRDARMSAFRDALKESHPELAGMDDDELNVMIDSGFSEANTRMTRDPRNAGMNMQSYRQLHDPRVQQAMRQRQDLARVRGMLSSGVSGVAVGSVASKVVDALQQGKPLDQVAMELGGGISADQLKETFGDQIKELESIKSGPGGLSELQSAQEKDYKQRNALEKKIADEKDPAARAVLVKQRDALSQQYDARQKDIDKKSQMYESVSDSIRTEMESMGISTDAASADATLSEAGDKLIEAAEAIKTAVGSPTAAATAAGAATAGDATTAATKPEGEAAAPTAFGGGQTGGRMQISGKLTVHSDGTATLVGEGGEHRGSVPIAANRNGGGASGSY